MVFDSGMADRISSRCDRMLKRAEPDVPNLLKEGKWDALGGVIKGACRNALQLAMIEIRCHNDIDTALSYLSKARDLSIAFETIPAGIVAASSLDIPIFCCLLTGDVYNAKLLAELISSGKMKVISGSHFDVHTQILAAFVLNDIKSFDKRLNDFGDLEPNYWWEKQGIYFRLYRAVLDNNESLFNELLNEAIKLFKERSTDKDFGNQLGEYGGLEYNQFAIDFMSVGIAVIAKSKGLSCHQDSVYFPLKLIR